MTTNTGICSECGRPLLISNGSVMCCYRHCPVYGHDVSEDVVRPHDVSELNQIPIQPVIRDPAARREEHLNVVRALWSDRDDPFVASEIVVELAQARQCEEALRERDAA
jgi:hypothetical protein